MGVMKSGRLWGPYTTEEPEEQMKGDLSWVPDPDTDKTVPTWVGRTMCQSELFIRTLLTDRARVCAREP